MAVSGLGDEDERKALDYISTRLAMMVKELDFALLFWLATLMMKARLVAHAIYQRLRTVGFIWTVISRHHLKSNEHYLSYV